MIEIDYTAGQIAEILDGKVVGNSDKIVNTVSKIEEATQNSLCFIANSNYEKYLYTSNAGIILVNRELKLSKELKQDTTLIKVEDSYSSFAKILQAYEQMIVSREEGISDGSLVDKTAKIGKNVYIGGLSYIGKNVVLGDNVSIYSNCTVEDGVIVKENTKIKSGVRILKDCKVGKNCLIDSGVVIGSEGFGFAPDKNKKYHRIPQLGNVVIEDDVYIGANTCIDRATIGSTRIENGVKIDNLVQLAHNTKVGQDSVIVSQVGVAGSTSIGKNVIIAGQAGLIGHLNIGNEVIIGAQSGVTRSVKDKERIQGSPAIESSIYRRAVAVYKKLPNMARKMTEIEKKLEILWKKNKEH